MAIYHLHVRVMQRSKGKNVVAASAYRRASTLKNHSTNQVWNYRSKPNVIHSEIIVPSEAPGWAKNIMVLHETDPSAAAERLWNLVEFTEKRVDSQLAREVEFALPIELNEAQNILLARSFIQDQFVLRGMIADWSVHWDEGNPHVHVLLTMRRLTENGFGQRALEWNNKALLLEWREQWAKYANYHLQLHQYHTKIDHRSYQDQGIDLIPGVHEGKADREMSERGIQRERLEESDTIRHLNLERITENPQVLLNKLSRQQEFFTKSQIISELSRYLSHKSSSTVLKRGSISHILNIISHHESVFSEREIAKAISPLTDNIDMFLKDFIQVKNCKELISLGIGEDVNQGYKVLSSKGEINISEGDRLLFLKNDRGLKVSNGQFGTVTGISATAVGAIKEFTVGLDNGQSVTINPREYQNFNLGYAATVHKAQGITIDRTLVYCAEGYWNRHLTYVAMTRHRQSCDLYAAQSVYKNTQSLYHQLSRSGLKDSVLDFPLAFAERRGFDIEVLGKVFQKHVLEKLNGLKDKLVNQIQTWKRSEIASVCPEKESEVLANSPDVSISTQMPSKLEKILIEYVKMEIEQGRLMSLKHKAYVSNSEKRAESLESIRSHAQKMKTFLKAAIECPEVKAAIESAKSIKPRDRGFFEIYECLKERTCQKEDITWVAARMRNKAMSWSCSQVQVQSRDQKHA